MKKIKELIIESKAHGRHTILYDACDADKVEPYSWYIMKGYKKKTYYAKRNLPRRADGSRPATLLMHRVLTECPKGMMVDHRNGNGLDNRQENMRVCTMSQNQMNRGKTSQNSTGFKGVYKTGDSMLNPYSAKIQKDGKVYCLGHYRTAEEAHEVRKKKEKALFGDFAPTGTPDS